MNPLKLYAKYINMSLYAFLSHSQELLRPRIKGNCPIRVTSAAFLILSLAPGFSRVSGT